MKQKRLWLCIGMATLLLAGAAAAADKSLSIGAATGSEVTLPVTMTSDAPVEGFVLSVAYDANLTATDVRPAGATVDNGAELVVSEILTADSGFTLGVVMDFNPPYDGQTIPAGTALIAEVDLTADLAALGLEPGEEVTLPVDFLDGLNNPPLYNIVVAGGLSYSLSEGLELADGSVRVVGKGDDLTIVSAVGAPNATSVPVSIVVDNNKPVEGFVLSITHDPAIALASIALGADAADAEFFVDRIYPNGGTFGVVMDFNAPYAGQTVDVGAGNELAVFTYTRACGGVYGSFPYNLTFQDNVFGTPRLANTLVEDGMSIPPNPIDGSVTFVCQQVQPPVEGFQFYVGGDTPPDSLPGDLGCAVGSIGGEVKMVLYYTSESQPIQGISMALRFDLPLQVADLDASGQGIVGADHLDGTITKGINAEFVSFNADNATGELIVGILVDSTPPVPINHMYPPRDTLGKVLNIFFTIPETAECETEYSIDFVNPVYGAGDVAIYNRVAVFNESYPATFDNDGVGGCITISGTSTFIRGDCNTDQQVDIADPAATMTYLFLGLYSPSCLDACDSNDDGMIDLADTVSTLRFLFKLGPILPDPGPYPPGGDDPTPDVYGVDLGCEAGDPCN